MNGSKTCGSYKDLLEKYNGSDKIVRVPDGITRILREAFSDNDTIEQVTLPESLRTIDSCTFADRHDLREVIITGPTLTIHDRAFLRCRKLE